MGSIRLNDDNETWLRQFGTPNKAIEEIKRRLGETPEDPEIKLIKDRLNKVEEFLKDNSGGQF